MAVPMRNTFQFYDRLMRSGLTEDQARVIIEAIEDLGEVDFKDFATKADLANLATKFDLNKFATKADLKEEINALRLEFKEDLAHGLAQCATKEDLAHGLAQCATKEDLVNGLHGIQIEVAKLAMSVTWMQRMFMGCILVIALGVIQGLTHFI